MELEAKGGGPNRSWTPVVPVPEETIAVAVFQWKRVPITRAFVARMLAYALIIVVFCTGLAYAASATSPAQYGARSEIKFPIDQGVSSSPFLREDRLLQTQLVTLQSRQILAPIAAKYHLSVTALAKKVSASVDSNSEIIQVQVRDHVPAMAQKLLGAITTAYMKQVPDPALAAETTLHAAIDEQTANINALTDQLNRLGPSAANTAGATALQNALTAALNRRTDLQGKYDDAVAAGAATQHVQQLTEPYLLDGKVSPKPVQAAIAGFLLGLMLAAGVIVLLFRRMLRKLPLDPNA